MRSVAAVVVVTAAVLAGCGKKGPPLAPLHLIPGPPTAIEVRRTGADAQLRFVLPAGNANGPGPSVLDRVQIYAVTLAPGMAAPANREFLTPKFLVGTVPVKPPPAEGEAPPAPDAPPDTRPSAGEKVAFVETLTPEKLAPASLATDKQGATAAARRTAGTALLTTAIATIPARTAGVPFATASSAASTAGPAAFAASFAIAASAAVTAAIPKYPVRMYALQGATKSGRPGQPSARAELPLVDLPGAPSAALATVTEKAIVLTWVAPLAEVPPAFNIYKRDGGDPLNPAPVAAPPFEQAGVTWGTESCFVIRAVQKIGAATIESAPSDPVCVTPRDVFPPAAPKGLSIVAGPGAINLSWDANQEPDLAGYLVLRGEAPGGTLQPLTPAPIAATNFEDRTATPGVRYVYTIVAIDKATPPNRSAPSARVEETAR
ncbi:MAG: hypothetical protein V7647_3478 [Acidobacteriota bacterium]|jgi:hypothetical protein